MQRKTWYSILGLDAKPLSPKNLCFKWNCFKQTQIILILLLTCKVTKNWISGKEIEKNSCTGLIQNYFLTISYLFSIPKNCSYLKFHCPFEVLHLEKYFSRLENFFPSWKNYLFHFSIEKIGKVKKIFCYHNCPDLLMFE